MTSLNRTLATLALLLAGALALSTPGPALAAESPNPPRHLAPYGLDWIQWIAPEDLPPTRYAVCLVDTGLAVTPDAPADNPAGPVLERLAIDGGSGAPQGTDAGYMHGTVQAATAVAPANDWGTIGVWPAGRVISVRASVEGETWFRLRAYQQGISLCRDEASEHPIAAVNLSLGCSCTLPDAEGAALEEEIASSRERGLSVVGAAGNTGGPTDEPARFPGVLAIAGGDFTGALCPYSSFDARVDLIGPACPVDGADPLSGEPQVASGGGSSAAATAASTLLAVLRTLRPDATREQAESWLTESARTVDGHRVLDGATAARLAGLEDVVERARARMPGTPAPAAAAPAAPTYSQTPSAPVAVPGKERLRAPRRPLVRWARGTLSVRVGDRPSGAKLVLTAVYLAREVRVRRRVRYQRATNTLRIRLRRPPHRVDLAYRPARATTGFAPSHPVILYRTASGRFRG